ncbi:TadE family type IV pilus minor pilin [Williamsia sp. SKLECPSW1]
MGENDTARSGPTRWARRLVRDDRGMVTVEAAFAIAAVVAVVVFGIGAVLGVATHVRCVDAAREVARLAAAGDPRAVGAGRSVAPPGAAITVSLDADTATARVRARSPLLPGVDLGATAVAAREPEADG